MRTTLTLDDDVAAALKQQARLLDKPFKQIVNEALRRGLALDVPVKRPPYRVKPFRSGYRPGVDPLRLKQLDEELQEEEFLKRHAQ